MEREPEKLGMLLLVSENLCGNWPLFLTIFPLSGFNLGGHPILFLRNRRKSLCLQEGELCLFHCLSGLNLSTLEIVYCLLRNGDLDFVRSMWP